MKKILVLFLLCGIGLGAWAQNSDSPVAVDAVNGLAVDLYKKLAAENDGNLFLSPYSISDALAMTYGGARGATAQEMAKVLYFPEEQKNLHESFLTLNAGIEKVQQKGEVTLNTANALWLQSDYKEVDDHFQCKDEFLKLLKDYYQSELNRVDYRDQSKSAFIRDTINVWVEKKTNSKIKNLIPPDVPSPNTRLILVNAVYFKGKWENEFKKDNTRRMLFDLYGVKSQAVQMMSQSGSFPYYEDDACKVLELPYKDRDLSMVIILPNAKDGLKVLERELTAQRLKILLNHKGISPVDVYLPKFQLENEYELADRLKTMGMPLAFDGAHADFTGMADFPSGNNLYISQVIHKAFVDVYEEGTEAAAATAVIMHVGSATSKPFFVADHPFLFLIKDNKTGVILFIGRYVGEEDKK